MGSNKSNIKLPYIILKYPRRNAMSKSRLGRVENNVHSNIPAFHWAYCQQYFRIMVLHLKRPFTHLFVHAIDPSYQHVTCTWLNMVDVAPQSRSPMTNKKLRKASTLQISFERKPLLSALKFTLLLTGFDFKCCLWPFCTRHVMKLC